MSLADTPVFDRLLAEYPHGVLDASGPAVGLPPGQMGNSEVGHLNIGAGRVVYQDLTRINLAIEDGSLLREPGPRARRCAKATGRAAAACTSWAWSPAAACTPTWATSRRCLELATRRGRRATSCVHAFLDGRDTPPQSAKGYLADHPGGRWTGIGIGRHGVISGRYYAMDRDNRWDRVKLAYDALVHGEGFFAADRARRRSTPPTRAARPTSSCARRSSRPSTTRACATATSCMFFNFRPDRARELTRAFTERGLRRVRPRRPTRRPSTSSP